MSNTKDRATENDKMTRNPLKCDLVPTGLDLNFQFNGKALLVRIFPLAKAVNSEAIVCLRGREPSQKCGFV